jgi:hypothetical protein
MTGAGRSKILLGMTVLAPELASDPHPQTLRPTRDVRRFWRVTLAIALPLGPLLVTISRAIMPSFSSEDRLDIVSDSLTDTSALRAGLWLGFFAIPLLLAGTLAIGNLARRRAPVLATVGTVITFLAFAGAAVVSSTDAVILAGGDLGLDPSAIDRILAAIERHPTYGIGIGLFVIGHIVGLVLLGIALRRSRVVAGWAAWAVAVSQPLHFVAFVILRSRALDVTAGWGLTTIRFLAVGVAIARTPNEEWDLAPLPRRRA